MTLTEQIITIGAAVLGTMVTRYLPFILFPANKKTPAVISYLGKMLPAAVMALLVIFAFKDVNFLSGHHGIPEILATIMVIILQVYVKNILLTIAAGTIVYMFLVQNLFI